MPHEEIAWWNFNIANDEQTSTCPDTLSNVSEKEMKLIGSWDANYEPLNWDDVKEIIGMLARPLWSHPSAGILLDQKSHRSQSFGQNAIMRHARQCRRRLVTWTMAKIFPPCLGLRFTVWPKLTF